MRIISAAFFVTICLSGGPAMAENQLESIETALGGSLVVCTGTVTWASEAGGGAAQEVPYSFAVRDQPTADRIALFDPDQPFMEENIWACESGFCTSLRVMRSGVTANAVRLSSMSDASPTDYLGQWAFIVIGSSGEKLQPESTSGEGVFKCNGALPDSILTKMR